MKVFVLTNVPVPYRVDFFNEIGKMCDLEVLFEQSPKEQIHRDITWFESSFENFKASFLYKSYEKKNPSKIAAWLKSHRRDLIVVMGYALPTEIYAIAWLRLHNVPFLLGCDGGFIKYRTDFKRLLKKLLVTSAEGYLSTGKTTDEFLVYYGAKRDRIYRIPFTTLYEKDILDHLPERKEKQRLRKELHITEPVVILSVGQFIYRKGYDLLIDACRCLKQNIGVYIVGSEPPREFIDLKNTGKLNNLHFVGFKKKNELSRYYKAADLFVLPTREDIWGLVINEAMAYGLPVITTKKCIAGLELVDDKNGKIVPVDDSEALGNAISELLSQPEKLGRMGQISLDRIRGYTIENMAYVHMSIFEDFYSRRVMTSNDKKHTFFWPLSKSDRM